MSTESTQKWLEVLGYNAFPVGLHRRVDDVSEKLTHLNSRPY